MRTLFLSFLLQLMVQCAVVGHAVSPHFVGHQEGFSGDTLVVTSYRRKINVREKSDYGFPTLEVQPHEWQGRGQTIKIRYTS